MIITTDVIKSSTFKQKMMMIIIMYFIKLCQNAESTIFNDLQ